jgi:choline dehydrogenase
MKALALAFALSCTASCLAQEQPAPFTYVIVGGGTAGLVVANRLSEDPSVTVAVIEPGSDQRYNSNVTQPWAYTRAFGTQIDWNYKTTPQPGVGGRQLDVHQGKTLGGTSAINGGV